MRRRYEFGWSLEERERFRYEKRLRQQEELRERQEKLKKFIELMRNFFLGSSIESEAEELIHTWEKQNFNKELVYANIQVQGLLKNHKILLELWNRYFENYNGGCVC